MIYHAKWVYCDKHKCWEIDKAFKGWTTSLIDKLIDHADIQFVELTPEQLIKHEQLHGIQIDYRLGKSNPAALPSFEAVKPGAVVTDELGWLEALLDIVDSGKNLVTYTGKC